MEKMKVFTKQRKEILKELDEKGYHVTTADHVAVEWKEDTKIVLQVYDWLVKHVPSHEMKPDYAIYPIWVSLSREATMLLDDQSVVLELEVDPAIITKINIFKWGKILNYSYIPKDEADAKAHLEKLEMYGISDMKAYMTPFYPDMKREIVESWKRLFDDSVTLGNEECYGIMWEVRKEWVVAIQKGEEGTQRL